ncbi:MAG: MBL fold metallo-hydrolase [Bacillota bacterium]
MKIQWLGHACFAIITGGGQTVITDPFDEKIGYPQPGREANVVTISHQHFDHNAANLVMGCPEVVQEAGHYNFGDFKIFGLAAFHDTDQGKKRGPNVVYNIEAEQIRVCHLGDLGHLFTPDQVAQIGPVDVLLAPVGGIYALDASEAFRVAEQLKAKYIIPMHYKTPYLELPINSPEKFLECYSSYKTLPELVCTVDSLPSSPEVVMLELATVAPEKPVSNCR